MFSVFLYLVGMFLHLRLFVYVPWLFVLRMTAFLLTVVMDWRVVLLLVGMFLHLSLFMFPDCLYWGWPHFYWRWWWIKDWCRRDGLRSFILLGHSFLNLLSVQGKYWSISFKLVSVAAFGWWWWARKGEEFWMIYLLPGWPNPKYLLFADWYNSK